MTAYTHSVLETIDLGQQLGRTLSPGAIVCFFGDLGSGKTTFIKGIIQSITDIPVEKVCSPTFTYLLNYEGKYTVYHFDLYRLNSAEDFLSLGFEEYLFSQGICCIEWSEKIESILPAQVYKVTLSHQGSEKRKICYEIPKY